MNIFFKPQFVEPILSGTKIHTLRTTERIKAGMALQFRTGSRFKSTLFFEWECVSVQKIAIAFQRNNVHSIEIYAQPNMATLYRNTTEEGRLIINRLIQNDGFTSEQEFIDFFLPKNFEQAKIKLNLIH